MEPAAAGILYAAENVLQGAAALVKGITHPTLPIKANLTRITSVPLPRSQHTVSVVKGRAYIFGGETAPGHLAENDMHIVILPSSGVLEADYTSKPAQAANGLDDVPASRKGHTAVVIGDTIYVFGGEGDSVSNENGRIWAYHTVSNTWSFLDPAP
jgi:N-acetylneuraminic acid mutarotase